MRRPVREFMPFSSSRSAATPSDARPCLSSARGRAGAAAVVLFACLLGAPGLTNESAVSLHGDAPKHLMNGVFLADLVRDRPCCSLDAVLEYAQLYYARYPALSLGHHPPLVAMIEAPVFLAFGVSTIAARMVQLVSLIAAALFLYMFVHERLGWTAGLVAAAIFTTSPIVLYLAQSIMSEMPALALSCAAAYALHRFTVTESRLALAAFVVAAALSLYAKQLAVFVFPAYLVMAVSALGVRRLLQRDTVIAASVLIVAVLPLVPMTLFLSGTNVRVTVRSWTRPSVSPDPWYFPIDVALTEHFTWSVLTLIVLGAARSLVRPNQTTLMFLVWTAAALAGLLAVGQWEPSRYGVYAVPALAALGASLTTGWRSRGPGAVATALLVAAIGHQTVEARRQVPVGLSGYEDAARLVLASEPGPVVLFSGDVDTGYFTFFVRKHDPSRSMVVMRADKILTTSMMGNPAALDRIDDRSQIYEQLRQFGIRYVVVEDQPSQSAVLEWLREELHSSRFAERKRIPIGTTDSRLLGTDLVVFEYLDAVPPNRDAELSMDLRIIRREVNARLSDLLDRKYLR